MIPRTVQWKSEETNFEFEYRPNVTSEDGQVTGVHDNGELVGRMSDLDRWHNFMYGTLEECTMCVADQPEKFEMVDN